MVIEFFIPLQKIPTVTHQQKQVHVVRGKPVIYESAALKDARSLFEAHLAKHVPDAPLEGPVRLVTKWLYRTKKYRGPTWKITKPDTDNMIKLFKDCMTKLNYWIDDAQVCSEVTEKYWNPTVSGVWVHVELLGAIK